MKKFLLAATVAALGAGTSLAQTAPAKPAAKSTEGKSVASKSLMTRDELRACMKLPETIKAKSAALADAKAALDKEKGPIEAANAELAALRADIDTQKAVVQKTDAAVRELSIEIEQWNNELKEIEDSPMKSAERRKKELKAQQPVMEARNKATVAERDKAFQRYEAAVEKYNTRAKDTEAARLDWNRRNKQLADESDKLMDMRDDYATDCTNRRFREEDEIAIKQGK